MERHNESHFFRLQTWSRCRVIASGLLSRAQLCAVPDFVLVADDNLGEDDVVQRLRGGDYQGLHRGHHELVVHAENRRTSSAKPNRLPNT